MCTDEQCGGVVEQDMSNVCEAELASTEHPVPGQQVDWLVEAWSAAACHRSIVPLTLPVTAGYG